MVIHQDVVGLYIGKDKMCEKHGNVSKELEFYVKTGYLIAEDKRLW